MEQGGEQPSLGKEDGSELSVFLFRRRKENCVGKYSNSFVPKEDKFVCRLMY